MYLSDYELNTYIDIELDEEEIWEAMSDYERKQLVERLREAEYLTVEPDLSEMEFDAIYDALDEGQKAHMFNRLLERDEFSHTNTNIARLVSALLKTSAAQSVTEV
jgi:hypothetical protein